MATCPTCAHLTAQGQRFCPSCGSALDELDRLPTGTAVRRSPSPVRARSPQPATPPASASASGRVSTPATPGAPAPRFVPGQMLVERYRIVGLLGRGGMGEVYRADDLRLGQVVALKFLPESLKDDPARRDRFYNEVRTARQIAHPAVCRVYDIGEAEGQPFLSMEYVDGEDLASLLRRIGRLPQDKAIEIARQVCAGVAAAHERGVLHRDLKPENVMLDGRGKVRITDFGLAGLASSIQGDDVRSGTPAYMSPEQLAGREVTTASDVYALGLVLYEVFTGRKPFGGRTLAEITRQHAEGTPVNPSQIVGEIDPAVERVILHCLEPDPRLRPPSALAVSAALPGGDPLAAALAAGETPSPELVAASGALEGLSPAAAWALLGVAVLVAVVGLGAVRRIQIGGYVPLDKPPQALEERAREALAALGQTASATDAAIGFAIDSDYLRQIENTVTAPDRWSGLRNPRPAAVHFYYRQSDRPLVSTSLNGRVYFMNPPITLSGMAAVELDPQGRLIGYYATTPQREDPAPAALPAVDWSPLFGQARLDPARFKPVPPLWTPLFHTDTRAAWVGTDAARPDLPLRLEAAGYRGKPVFFQMVWDWTRPERMEAVHLRPGQTAGNRVGVVLILAITATAFLLARHNVRVGRGDRAGARRLALLTLAGELVSWALGAHHVADVGGELALIARGLGLCLIVAGAVWVLYLAIEPYVRRHWPDMLVSWTRLLAGRWRDPLVGRDVLLGTAVGAVVVLAIPFVRVIVLGWLSLPPPTPFGEYLDITLSPRFVLAGLVDITVSALANAMLSVLILIAYRLVLRREILAAAAFMVTLSLQSAVSSPLPFVPALLLNVLGLGAPLYFVMRQGVLVAAVAVFVANLMAAFPIAPSLGHWSADPAIATILVVAALALYGFRTAQRAYSPRILAPAPPSGP
jgi:eukaryotic-like serine/threonine-protein kinase